MNTNGIDAVEAIEKALGRKVTFGMLLKMEREERELSQAKMGELLGLPKAYISDLENGRRGVSIKKALEIAKILKLLPKTVLRIVIEEEIRQAGESYKVILDKI